MPTQNIIPVTPGSGLDLDAVSLTIGLNTVYRETMVIADPTNATYLATVTSAGALNVTDSILDGCITANVLAVSLPAGQVTTLTPPTAAAIGTAVSTDLLIGTQLAAASVPVALPTATITALTPPTAAAIAAAIVANPPAVTVSGSVGVTQSTSPWVVAGGGTAGTAATGVVTVQGIAAMTPLLVTATFAASQHVIVDSGTITAVTSITNPVAVTGTFWQATQPVSIASGQVASGAFASGSIASGAIASGAIASGAIAAGAAAAGAFADGSVFVRSNAASTFPVTAIGTLTHNNAAPTTNNLGALVGVASAGAPTYTTGDQVLLSTDLSGNLRTTGTFTGTITGAVTGTLTNNNAAPSTNNLGVLPALANAADPTWNEGDLVTASVTLAGYQRVILHAETTKVIGVVRASDGAGNLLTSNSTTPAGHFALDSNITSILGTAPTTAGFIDIKGADGNVFVRQATASNLNAAVVGTKTNNNAAPGATNLGVLPGIANAATQTWTEGDQVLESMDLSGRQRIRGTLTNNNAAPAADQLSVIPAVANAAAPTWTEGDQVLLSVNLSGQQRVLTTPAAGTTTTIAGNLTNNNAAPAATEIGVLPAVANAAEQTWTEGDQVLLSTDLSGRLRSVVGRTLGNSDAITSTIGSPANTFNIAITGPAFYNGSTWDRARSASIGNAVAATGIQAHAAYGEYLSAAPAPTTGQYSALQTDNAGSLFTKNTRRSQTAAQGTTISSTTSATAVTATPAAATFADLSQLIITVGAIATTAIAFTATLSDGTATYIYDLDTGVIASGGADPIIINFNPPLPATSAATGWTVALSVNTVVAHVTTIVILQKAS